MKSRSQFCGGDWVKHYPASTLAKTIKLGHVELGVYRRLMDLYWVNDNRLPQDVRQVAEEIGDKIISWHRYDLSAPAGFDNEEVTRKVAAYILEHFFYQDEDGDWRHEWLDEYRQAAETEFKSRSDAHKKCAARLPRDERGRFHRKLTDAAPLTNGVKTIEENRADQTREEQSTQTPETAGTERRVREEPFKDPKRSDKTSPISEDWQLNEVCRAIRKASDDEVLLNDKQKDRLALDLPGRITTDIVAGFNNWFEKQDVEKDRPYLPWRYVQIAAETG